MKIQTFILTFLISVFLFVSVSFAAITCNPCDVGNCECSITDCSSGTFGVYTKSTCSGFPSIYTEFSGGHVAWAPDQTGTYYLKAHCDGASSACTPQKVPSGSTTTTTQTTATTSTTRPTTSTTRPTTSTTRPTTSTTRPTTVLTTTATTIAPIKFSVSQFNCTSIANGYKCSAAYNNSLNENAIFLFLYKNERGKVMSAPASGVNTGSGITYSLFYCSTYGAGTYKVSYKVYRASDTSLSDVIYWSNPSEEKAITCS
jgi:hypothetical protein